LVKTRYNEVLAQKLGVKEMVNGLEFTFDLVYFDYEIIIPCSNLSL